MDESRLDKDLRALAKGPQPDLPADFNEKVWSRVQSREKRFPAKRESWLRALFSLCRSPQWAVAAFAFAIFVGWMAARVTAVPGTNLTETRVAASVTGEVIDMACYFDNGASGPGHAECAKMCIASGLPVGLKTRDGTIYVLIGKQLPPSPQPTAMHESLNAQIAQYAAKIVTVSGTVVSKKGMNVIENAQLLNEEAQWQQNPDQITDSKSHLAHFL
jgi:hypothetical protein